MARMTILALLVLIGAVAAQATPEEVVPPDSEWRRMPVREIGNTLVAIQFVSGGGQCHMTLVQHQNQDGFVSWANFSDQIVLLEVEHNDVLTLHTTLYPDAYTSWLPPDGDSGTDPFEDVVGYRCQLADGSD